MVFDGGQKGKSAFAEALQKAQDKSKTNSAPSARGNITTRSVLTGVDAAKVTNDIEQRHLREYQENSKKQQGEQEKLKNLIEREMQTCPKKR